MTKVPTISCRQLLRNTSASGDLTRSPRSTARTNTGVSASRTRTYRPITTITALSRNGIRQPQVRNAPPRSALAVLCPNQPMRARNSPLAIRKPIGAPSCGHIAAQALFPGRAVSVASNAAPLHSPPSASPWVKRNTASSAGASRPTWW